MYSCRLWMETTSDKGKGNGKGANQFCSTQVRWGSANDSKNCVKVDVHWKKGDEKPTATIKIGDSTYKIEHCIETCDTAEK